MKRKKLLLIVGIAIVVIVVVVLNLTSSSTTTIDVQADAATVKTLVEIVSASGRIQPRTKVEITSEINGEIIGLYVREGDRVQTGQSLVVLDTMQLRSDVDQAKYAVSEVNARLTGAKASLEQAEEEYQRQEKLYESKLTSETAYTSSKYAYLNSKSMHEATVAQADQLRARYDKQLDYLSKAKIVAPMSGIITFLDCEVGEIAAAQTAFTQGRTLMTISDLRIFEVEVEVDETEINKIELGQVTDIEVDAFPDTSFPGEVVEIGNTAILSGYGTQEQSTNFKVKVVFKDPNVKIRPGMSATVDITTEVSPDAMTIPYSAVVMRAYDLDSLERERARNESGGTAGIPEVQAAEETLVDSTKNTDNSEERKEIKGVFIVKDDQARFVPIETGIADKRNIEVLKGITDGDSVITGPYRVLRSIKDGEDVKVEKNGNKKIG
jgi:HlyD family secretion protein